MTRKYRLLPLILTIAMLLYGISMAWNGALPSAAAPQAAAPLSHAAYAAPTSCITPPPNMTAWYPLDEAAGPTSYDIIGGNNGNWIGSGLAAVPGKVALALRFAGPGGYVLIPDAPAINFGAGDFSIDTWLKEPPGVGGRRVFLDKRSNTSPAPTGYALTANGGQLVFQMGDGSFFNDYPATSGPALNDGNWHLIAVTVQRATATATLYVDGAVVGVYSNLPGSVTNPAPLTFGLHHPITTLPYQETDFGEGILDEVELFNRALTQGEIVSIFTADSFGKCKQGNPTATPTCPPGISCATPSATATSTPCDPARGCATDTPTATDTPHPTDTPAATDTPHATDTATPTVCPNGCQTNTPSPTPSCIPGTVCATATPTPCDPALGCATNTPTATATPTSCGPVGCPTSTPTVCPNGQCPSPTPTSCGPVGCPTATPTFCPNGCQTPTPTPHGCIAPPANMVAWYPLDETVGPTSYDIVNANNGAWVGGPVPVPGKVAGALSFNGHSYVQAPNSPTLNFGSGDLSIDAWVKTYRVPGAVVLVDKRANIFTTPIGYAMYLYNGKLGFQLADGSGWSNYIAFLGPNVGDGNWHLIAVSVQRTNSAGLKLYVDGVLVATGNPTFRPGSLTSLATLRIGGPQPGPYHDRFLRGSLDEVELFNRALGPSEFAALFQAGSAGKCKDHNPTPTATPTATPCIPGAPCPTTTPQASATPIWTPRPTFTWIPNPFVDINGNIFSSAIRDLYSNGAVNGTDSTHFTPGGQATRAQFAKVVVVAFGILAITPATPDFTDVPPTYFAYQYIESGYYYGILGGYDAGSCVAAGATFPCYLPNRPITRAELTKLVVSAAGYDLTTPGTPSFSDVPPSYFVYAFIETAHAHGVINGYPDGTFRPNNPIRRDEMAQIVYQGLTQP